MNESTVNPLRDGARRGEVPAPPKITRIVFGEHMVCQTCDGRGKNRFGTCQVCNGQRVVPCRG